MNSKSLKQLAGETNYEKNECYPAITNKQMGKTKSHDNIDLKEDDTANPCGLIAKSFFNDLFTLKKNNNEI